MGRMGPTMGAVGRTKKRAGVLIPSMETMFLSFRPSHLRAPRVSYIVTTSHKEIVDVERLAQ